MKYEISRIVTHGQVGIITSLGYLYCDDCAGKVDATGTPVMADDAPHGSEPCDRCWFPVNEVR